MNTPKNENDLSELPQELRFAFAPLIKRAMGISVGLTFGLTLLFVNIGHLLFAPDQVKHLWLMRNFFVNYNPETWLGAFVGFLWALWTGFVMGWMFAAIRNFVVAVWIIMIRAKANLTANREFLDHI